MRFTHLPSSSLRLTGADRVDFVQGQMTNDLKRASVPGMVEACFLNVRGQIEFHARVYKRTDDVYLHLASGEAPKLAERLRKYVIFDQVELEDLSDTLSTLHVWTEDLPGWQANGPDTRSFDLEGTAALASRVNRTGRPGLDVHVLTRHLERVVPHLGEPVSLDELNRARVLAGIPDVHEDRLQGNLLQEVGLEPAISYRKGCYVGQEIMARLEARGNTRFRLAALQGADLPSFADVTSNGKSVGTTGASIGERVLVKLRKEVEVGATVDVGGVTAVVVEARPVPHTAEG
ncbi:YgfZ/GcvT domain-containing protein [Deinococcus yavapaiensis]|uniref:Uncharacterized protein n=1 Tax=Deinococcus yavapaiensis KR-236 TaxID=694435 RepID=A0A318SEN1_9DEIO|nr:folate-binding protein YgfZ [Deinococcus yavapaiensis]PYE55685.1 hypothetical protein DES52_10248 [Deinococcus yavapaiensis KR-236]